MWRLTIPLGLLIAGCTTQSRGYEHPRVTGIQVISTSEAKRQRAPRRRTVMRFGPRSSSEQLLVDLLAHSRAAGASMVSNIEIHQISQRRGRPVDCVTHIGPKHEIEIRYQTRSVAGYAASQRTLQPVHRTVTDYVRRCTTRSYPVTRTRTVYTSQYDSYTKSYRSVPQTRYETHYESRYECRQVPISRTATHYEDRWTMNYVPSRWETVARHYSRWSLVQSQPVCQPLRASASIGNHVTATIFGSSVR